ncbi:hypothetical protein [Clostridium paraputrificum]|uniref:hypothetical protein n=1 Tax=Clostridium paraputrificum TaxID=29363 RepID=UPI000C081EB0|nr:hypothetical protein [Clostridium paraputrificum]
MDERLIEIFKLVFLLNQKKHSDLKMHLTDFSIDIVNETCESIIPHWTKHIYLDEFWKNDYDDMVNNTLEMLKEMLEGAENE